MLSAPQQSHKKRQRRRKKSDVFTASTSSSMPPTKSKPRPHIIQPKARLKASFVQEQLEVDQSIIAHCQKGAAAAVDDNGGGQLQQQQDELDHSFFTASIAASSNSPAILSQTHQPGSDDDCQAIKSSLKTPSIGAAADDDDENNSKQQLTSSYIHDDISGNDPLTVKWQKEKVHFDQLETNVGAKDLRNQTDPEASPTKPIRNIESEGLFQWPKPSSASKRNVTAMQTRFGRHDDDSDWILQNVRDYNDSSVLIKTMETAKQFHPIRYAAAQPQHTLVINNEGRDRLLCIQIDAIQFDALDEQAEAVVADKMEHLYNFYIERMNSIGTIQHLEQKLEMIRHLLESSSTLPDADHTKWLRMLRDRRDIRQSLYRELQIDRDVLKRLLELWMRLKEIRTQQGHTKTPYKMIIKAEPTDVDADRNEWDAKFDIEFRECLEEAIEELNGASATGGNAQSPAKIRNELNALYGRSLRPPGEPKLLLQLRKSATTKATNEIPPKPTKYFIEIRVDGQQAATAVNSKPILSRLNRIPLSAMFSIKLPASTLEGGRNVQLFVYQLLRLGQHRRHQLVDLYLPVPAEHEHFAAATFVSMSFTTIPQQRCGQIAVKLGWSVTAAPDDRNCPCSNSQEVMHRRKVETAKLNTIEQWIDDELLDPLDPDAASLVQSIRHQNVTPPAMHVQDNSAVATGLFRFNEDQSAFCTAESIDGDKRLNRLIDRFQANVKFKNVQFVPSTAREIEDDDDGMGAEAADGHFEAFEWMDPIDLQRHEGKKFMKNLYKEIANYCEILNKNSVSQDLLIGDAMPTVRYVEALFITIYLN